MSKYRLVLALIIVLCVGIAASFPFFRAEDASVATRGLLGLGSIADLLATGYLVRLFIGSTIRPRSWLLATMTTTAALVTVGLLCVDVIVLFPVGTFDALIARMLIDMGHGDQRGPGGRSCRRLRRLRHARRHLQLHSCLFHC